MVQDTVRRLPLISICSAKGKNQRKTATKEYKRLFLKLERDLAALCGPGKGPMATKKTAH